MKKLFSEFSPASAAEWKQQIIKDLKGADLSKLTWHNPNGFEIDPFYTKEDLVEKPAPLFSHTEWEVCEEINVDDERSANAAALRSLNKGASGLLFILSKNPDLDILLNEISIEHIGLNFSLKYKDDNFVSEYQSYLTKKNISPSKLNGGVSFDPIANLTETGNWFEAEEKDLAIENYFCDAGLYQNAGATQSFELACTLAHAHEYLILHSEKNKVTNFPFHFTIAIGSDFFGEIAKLRALRKLWVLVTKEYNVTPHIRIHCRTSSLNKSSADPHTNMLRTTTEGMSAIIGGCNSLTLEAYNSSFEKVVEAGTRIARNQQLICKEESYLNKVADMGAGSYYIEKLTDELAKKAWEEFKIIETQGGFVESLKKNYIQEKIKEQAKELIQQFKEGKIILVGVNKYRSPTQGQEPRSKSQEKVQREHLIIPIEKLILEEYFVKQHA